MFRFVLHQVGLDIPQDPVNAGNRGLEFWCGSSRVAMDERHNSLQSIAHVMVKSQHGFDSLLVLQSTPSKEKDDLLVTALSERGEGWRNDLMRRFLQHESQRTRPAVATQRRTVRALLESACARAQERTRRLEAGRAAKAARRKAEEEADRACYLDRLERFEEATWSEVAAHIQKRQPNEYDKAVQLLIDLRDLAARRERLAPFQAAVEEIRRKHAAKESFLRRLAKSKL